MNDVQKCELNILKYFHDFCVKHDLKYFLASGTLLGAIRHKGFIPWDDDIDVFMPRADYDKLHEIAKKEMNVEGNKYFLQSYETDPNYPYNFMKIRDNDTTFVEKNFKFVNMNQGVWIDIFPLDGLSSDEKIAKKRLRKFHYTWLIFYLSYFKLLIHKIRLRRPITDFLANVLGYLFYFYNYKNKQNRRIDRITTKYKYEESTYVSSAQDLIKCKIFKREFFDELELHEFEGEQFYIPKRYDEYLTEMYGDYMKLPPVDKQIGHHFTAYENLNLSWRDFKKDYRNWRHFKKQKNEK